jgi:hypothetical protein
VLLFYYVVTCLLKAGIAEPEETAVIRERTVNTLPRLRIHVHEGHTRSCWKRRFLGDQCRGSVRRPQAVAVKVCSDEVKFFSESLHQGSPSHLHCVKIRNISSHRHRRREKLSRSSSICHNRKFREQVGQYILPVRLTMTC